MYKRAHISLTITHPNDRSKQYELISKNTGIGIEYMRGRERESDRQSTRKFREPENEQYKQ
jgi:hypothetical protein